MLNIFVDGSGISQRSGGIRASSMVIVEGNRHSDLTNEFEEKLERIEKGRKKERRVHEQTNTYDFVEKTVTLTKNTVLGRKVIW